MKVNMDEYLRLKGVYQDEWREKIFARDGYKCRVCGSVDNLHLSHITPARAFVQVDNKVESIALSYREDNLIALCYYCHRGHHRGTKILWDDEIKVLAQERDRLKSVPEVRRYIELSRLIGKYANKNNIDSGERRKKLRSLLDGLKLERGWGSAISAGAHDLGYRLNERCHPLRNRAELGRFVVGKCLYSSLDCLGEVKKCEWCGLTFCAYHTATHRRGAGGSVGRGPRRYEVVDGLSASDAELKRMHLEEWLSAKQIGERIGENALFVRERLKGLGVYNGTIRSFRKQPLDGSRMYSMYQQGYSPAEIGRVVKLSTNSVVHRLRKVGLFLEGRTPVDYIRAKIASGELPKDAMKRFSCRRGNDRWRKLR